MGWQSQNTQSILSPKCSNMGSKFWGIFNTKLATNYCIFSSKEQRDEVIGALIGHCTEVYGIAHAADLLEKVSLQLNFWQTREQQEITQSLKKVFSQKNENFWGFQVYSEWATAEQRHAIVTEFYGNEFALFKVIF